MVAPTIFQGFRNPPPNMLLLSLCLIIFFSLSKCYILLLVVTDVNVLCELATWVSLCLLTNPLCCKLNLSNNFSNRYGLMHAEIQSSENIHLLQVLRYSNRAVSTNMNNKYSSKTNFCVMSIKSQLKGQV